MRRFWSFSVCEKKEVDMTKEPSHLERLKQLDEERSSILEVAKEEALELANQAIQALNALGFNYRLTGGSGRSSGPRKGTRQANAERPCPICGFTTEPPHDARRHRSQQPKRPFTDAELETNHMRRV